MPVKSIEKVLDGHEIKIVQFHAVRGFKVKARLFKLILPILSPLIGSVDIKNINASSIIDKDIDLQKVLPQAFSSLSESIDEETLFKLLLDLLQSTWVDGKEVNEQRFNELFIANYTLAYKLAYEVVMANHFFDFGGITNLLKTQAEEKKQPPEKK